MITYVKDTQQICSFCKKKFLKPRISKYCSQQCQWDSLRRTDERDCARKECSNSFTVKHSSKQKFCSSSCAGIVNNQLFPKRSMTKVCKVCPVKIPSSRTYCDEHKLTGQSIFKIQKWLDGEWDGATGEGLLLSTVIREYLLEQAEYKCSKCGFDTPHPDDGRSILEIDHIDGDGANHLPENLRVVCPNCHALTSTYRARNIGNGRKVFYRRYAIGIVLED